MACNSLSSPIVTTPQYTTYQAQGDSAAVAASLDAFRAALGGPLNAPNSPPADSGRREINWDGVPAAVTNVDTFPLAFFNVNSKRGALLSTPGTGLRVDSTAFGDSRSSAHSRRRSRSPPWAAIESRSISRSWGRARMVS